MCLLVCAKARYRKPPTGGLADSTGVRRKSGLRFRRVTRIKNARRTRARVRMRTSRILPRLFFSLFTSQTNKSTYVSLVCFSFSLYRSERMLSRTYHSPFSLLRTVLHAGSAFAHDLLEKKQYGLTLPRNNRKCSISRWQRCFRLHQNANQCYNYMF